MRGGAKVLSYVTFVSGNWGYVSKHLKGRMSVRRSSQWKLLNTYTESALQQTEIVQLSSGELFLSLFFFWFSTHLPSRTDNVDPIVCY